MNNVDFSIFIFVIKALIPKTIKIFKILLAMYSFISVCYQLSLFKTSIQYSSLLLLLFAFILYLYLKILKENPSGIGDRCFVGIPFIPGNNIPISPGI